MESRSVAASTRSRHKASADLSSQPPLSAVEVCLRCALQGATEGATTDCFLLVFSCFYVFLLVLPVLPLVELDGGQDLQSVAFELF